MQRSISKQDHIPCSKELGPQHIFLRRGHHFNLYNLPISVHAYMYTQAHMHTHRHTCTHTTHIFKSRFSTRLVMPRSHSPLLTLSSEMLFSRELGGKKQPQSHTGDTELRLST